MSEKESETQELEVNRESKAWQEGYEDGLESLYFEPVGNYGLQEMFTDMENPYPYPSQENRDYAAGWGEGSYVAAQDI